MVKNSGDSADFFRIREPPQKSQIELEGGKRKEDEEGRTHIYKVRGREVEGTWCERTPKGGGNDGFCELAQGYMQLLVFSKKSEGWTRHLSRRTGGTVKITSRGAG